MMRPLARFAVKLKEVGNTRVEQHRHMAKEVVKDIRLHQIIKLMLLSQPAGHREAAMRKVLEDTARETQAFVYETAVRQETELLAKLKQAGMQVNEVDKDAFIKASAGIYEDFGKEVAGAKPLIDKAVALDDVAAFLDEELKAG